MEGVETLESKSLGVNFLKTFVLPESLKSIASDALIDCEINSLFFQSITPPTLSNGDGGLTAIDKIGQIYMARLFIESISGSVTGILYQI